MRDDNSYGDLARGRGHVPVPTFLSSTQTELSRSEHRAYTFYENIF